MAEDRESLFVKGIVDRAQKMHTKDMQNKKAKIMKFASQTNKLQRGDLVKLDNGELLFIDDKLKKTNSVIVTIPYIGANRLNHLITPEHLAMRTTRIIRSGDADYNATLLAFAKQDSWRY